MNKEKIVFALYVATTLSLTVFAIVNTRNVLWQEYQEKKYKEKFENQL